MRWPLFFFFFVLPLACVACGPQGTCEIACLTNDMVISSANADLVSAHDSCGQSVACSGLTCSLLELPPPPNGGACSVTIVLVSGQITTNADWGAPHDTSCCGTQYANTPHLEIAADAGVD